MTTISSGQYGIVAAQSVLRVICLPTSYGGTGFLHKSGIIITAAHVVEGCKSNDLLLVLPSGKKINVVTVKFNTRLDLAILEPRERILAPTLSISTVNKIDVGTQVATWGFPAGYNGPIPLLSVGYLAGADQLDTPAGLSPIRWVVNAAFNSGNSGGPVLSLEDGSIIGVVSSKLAPIPPIIKRALDALSNQRSGFTYTITSPSGEKSTVTEGQVIAGVLKYLRSQTQLVLGHAVTSKDLITFLKHDGIKP